MNGNDQCDCGTTTAFHALWCLAQPEVIRQRDLKPSVMTGEGFAFNIWHYLRFFEIECDGHGRICRNMWYRGDR